MESTCSPFFTHLFGGDEVGDLGGSKALMPASPKCDMRKSWPKMRLAGLGLNFSELGPNNSNVHYMCITCALHVHYMCVASA